VDSICYKPIGIGHSPFKEPKRVPIQPIFAEKVEGKNGAGLGIFLVCFLRLFPPMG